MLANDPALSEIRLEGLRQRAAIIIDRRIAYIGGAGFQEHFETGEFHDLLVRMTGAIASQFQLVFRASFRYLGGPPVEDLEALIPNHEQADGAVTAIARRHPAQQPIRQALTQVRGLPLISAPSYRAEPSEFGTALQASSSGPHTVSP